MLTMATAVAQAEIPLSAFNTFGSGSYNEQTKTFTTQDYWGRMSYVNFNEEVFDTSFIVEFEAATLDPVGNYVQLLIETSTGWIENTDVDWLEGKVAVDLPETTLIKDLHIKIAQPGTVVLKRAYFGNRTCHINATANNSAYGSVQGGGKFIEKGVSITLTATANFGYGFANWTKNGIAVSAENPYTFIATEDIELIANFKSTNANLQSLAVNDAEMTPEFETNITNYTINVSYFKSYIDGYGYTDDNKATVGTYANAFKFFNYLQVGENIIPITVIAEDGTTQKTYTLTVTREALQEREETINITEAGTLNSTLFADIWNRPIIKLTITGNIDARDIYFLDSLQYLTYVDLGNANIVAYEGQAGWYQVRFYPANELPDYSLDYVPYLTSIILPKTLTSIGNTVLNIRSIANFLTSIHIPEGVTKVGYGCFIGQNALTTVILPSTLTEIGGDSFLNCNNLSVVINHNPNPIDIGCVFSCGYPFYGNVPTLYVPFGSGNLYREKATWKEFNIIELPDMSADNVSITPSDSTALIEWQPYENAEGYRIIIYSDEAHTDIVCILEFDADGKFINIIRYKAKSVMQTASENYSYMVESLLSGTDYYYTLEILGADNVVLTNKSGTFTTTDEPSGIDAPLTEPAFITGYYSILGAKLPKEPQSGMYIIMYSNGKAKKVLK